MHRLKSVLKILPKADALTLLVVAFVLTRTRVDLVFNKVCMPFVSAFKFFIGHYILNFCFHSHGASVTFKLLQ